ncbi:universal stress protein [Nitrosomonas marina]|uniref:Nucleotide-binding universal stress protein, UspA family n=1 Tax=Nitrosomonas marina TaxID=917 RepID=A0A1H8C7I8_9PROT|nr:universal stress protein [Nitrosomonas marina]SEM91025.1 Nucleotide-binding universal stress protein, UspA family [Nitrosomonas marina]
MYKKVMVAVDGSETASQALTEAENIANTYDAILCIAHAVQGDTEADKQTGTDILEKAKSSAGAQKIETRLVQANIEYGLNGIAEAIADAAADWEADLLVVGTANRRGLERFFVGSVAEQLVAKVSASILLVRPQST